LSTHGPHRFSKANSVVLSTALALATVLPLAAGPQITVNGNVITRSNEALPLKVLHGKAIRLGDEVPALTADLFETVYLHSDSAAAASPKTALSNSFYDANRDDDLPVKEMPVAVMSSLPQEPVAPVPERVMVKVETEMARLDPMVMSGRLNLMQVPAYVALLESEEKARTDMGTSVLFADLKTKREDLPEVTELPNFAPRAERNTQAHDEAVTVTSTADRLIASTDEPAAFSLANVANEKAFLESAWVNYDQGNKEFKATWSKPPLFHYGMVLLPEIAKRVAVGQEVEFRYKDMPAKLTKDEKGRLFVTAAGEARLVTAGKLKKLLEEKIETDGMILFLDQKGNLVLHASGNNALVMNQHAAR